MAIRIASQMKAWSNQMMEAYRLCQWQRSLTADAALYSWGMNVIKQNQQMQTRLSSKVIQPISGMIQTQTFESTTTTSSLGSINTSCSTASTRNTSISNFDATWLKHITRKQDFSRTPWIFILEHDRKYPKWEQQYSQFLLDIWKKQGSSI